MWWKILLGIFGLYVLLVVAFETWLGYSQPTSDRTIVITTFDDAGNAADRVVTAIEDGDDIWVSANHWPRAWYHAVLDNPELNVTIGDATGPYVAVPATDEEDDYLSEKYAHPMAFRILTGFPPRYFVRLDPVPT